MKTCQRFGGLSCWAVLITTALNVTASPIVLISPSATWKYLGDGTDQGVAWQQPGYDDSAWLAGPAQLGYGDGDEATVVTTVSPRPVTVYFRRALFVPAGLTSATVRLLRDDGAVVYVNGVEVMRNNMPAGPISFNTLATVAVGGAEETSNYIQSAISPAPFVAGTNIIAVEIHQNSLASSDMSFALELIGDFGTPWPTVTVEAMPNETREVSPFVDIPVIPAVFRVTRTGPTNNALNLSYTMSGSASNGLDYEFVPGTLSIAAGSEVATVEILAIDDLLAEGTETVVLSINPTACPECYTVGNPGSAIAFIIDDEPTNSPPVVTIFQPGEGAAFTAPTNIELRATAHDPEDGENISVEFFNGTNRIGAAMFYPTLCPANCPYFALTWSNVPPGNHTLIAVARDSAGATTVSAPVHISVSGPPPTNLTVVRVFAFDSNAVETAGFVVNTGRFTFMRTGNIGNALPVYFTLSGTAANGQDYLLTNNFVVIPAGASNAHLILRPLDDFEVEPTETVVLNLLSPPTSPMSVPYQVGFPASATVVIFDNDTNPPPPTVVSLIPTGSVWRYLDDGTDQGTAWRAPLFDDAAWQEGPAQLGYGDGDELTVLNGDPDGDGLKFITYYFRRPFVLSNATTISNLTLRLLRDDGAVVYVNGVEVFRSNMPEGTITYQTLAIENVGPPFETTQFVSAAISPSALVNGVNVVAVELHQVGATSADLSFDLELLGSRGPEPERTVVNVVALDAQATEPGPTGSSDTGRFAFRRTGNLNTGIPVYFAVGGSAQNGSDYLWISNTIVIPAGATQAVVTVSPLADNIIEDPETVVLTLETPPCFAIFPPPPQCYELGFSRQATVFINELKPPTNNVPFVQLNQPANGDTFFAPTSIVLQAYAQDAEDGNALQVEFFAGTTSLGFGTFVPTLCPSPYCPFYSLIWSNVPVGTHTLTARATDSAGASGVSAPVTIHVQGGGSGNELVIRFDPPSLPHGSRLISNWVENGFFFSTPNGMAHTDSWLANYASNGSAFLTFGANHYPLTFEQTSGALFDLLSVELAEYSTVFAVPRDISFFGFKPDGSVVSNMLHLDGIFDGTGPLTDFQTFTLGAGFSGLTRVVVTPSIYSLDNVRVATGSINEPERTVVNLVVTDAQAREASAIASIDPGQFAIRRSGNLASSIPVQITLAGTAGNGIDYAYVSNVVIIPAGATQALINILPLQDGIVENTETVVLTIQNPVCPAVFPPPPECYLIAGNSGSNSASGTVLLFDGSTGTNRPSVRVFAADNTAAESSGPENTGLFIFTRSGSISNALTVFFALSGSAVVGADYAITSSIVVIPAGSSNAQVVVHPIDDSIVETNETVVLTLLNPPTNSFTYQVASPFSATVSILDNDSQPPTGGTLIAAGSEWKYNDLGIDLGATWREPGFDDSAWTNGPAQLGYGDGDEATIVSFGPDSQNKYITTYFRRSFAVTNAAGISNLMLRLLRDDGGVVYLNGVEVFRSNMPTGSISFPTLAIASAEEPSAFHSALIDPSLLVNGKNVIAVEIHQNNALSSDLSFDLDLVAGGGTSKERTIVQVLPQDSQASEPGGGLIDLGRFDIRRSGNINSSIPVSFTLGGSASNGVDYVFITNEVVIPAGATQALVTVTPLSDNLVEGTDIVILTLVAPVCPAIFPPPPECYDIGASNSAVVFIADAPGGTNQPPLAFWVAPTNSSVFTQGTGILLRASAFDFDGAIARVEFYRGSIFLGSAIAPGGTNYSFMWSNALAGTHTMRAVAVDNLNARGTSGPVTITVLGQPGTNVPIVRVFATDANAMEGSPFPDEGRFNVTRTGPISNSLPVYFSFSGTAASGVDFGMSSNVVVIPPGSSNAFVTLRPIDDNEVEPDETAVMSIVPPPPGVFSLYSLGSPSTATVFIHDNDSNAPPVTNATLIAAGSVWKYLDDGSDQGTAWRSALFEDSTWPEGPAQLGFGDGDEATLINGPFPAPYVTAYFRRAFDVGNPAAVSNLTVRLLRDDGGVVYLNGVEVFRSNMPTGQVNYTTLALTAAGGADETSNFYSAPVSSSLLVSGRNIIAVEIHQNALTSSDLSFDLELTADRIVIPEERTVIHVVVSDPVASELMLNDAPNPGQFAIRRAGNLSSAIPVLFRLSGTASNGVDYNFISNRVVIPAGATQTVVNIVPRVDNLAEGTETVTLTLESIGCIAIVPPPPECYIVGSPSQATLNITDAPSGTTNRPPVAFWLAPSNGSVFMQGTSILLRASALDVDGAIARVEFFRGTTFIGSTAAPGGTNYVLAWSNAPAGGHVLRAVAVDNLNARGTSAPVNISVVPRPTNAVPTVTIVTPPNGAEFPASANIAIEAVTVDPDGYADRVEFFADSQKIGEAQVVFIQAPNPGDPIQFEFTWTNPPPGQHILTATTVDNLGARGVSAPVNITVGSGPVVHRAPRNQQYPAVAANNELYFVVWADQREFNNHEWDIYGARVTRDGEVLDPNGIRICALPGIQSNPSIASDGRDFFVTWNDARYQESASDFDIYGARVTAEGIVIETNGFPISTAPYAQFYPSVAFNGADYLLAWYDYRNSDPGTRNDIYGARVSQAGALLDPNGLAICIAENMQWAPGVASLNGDFFVAWDDARYPANAIRGTRVNGAGVVSNPDGVSISPHFSGYPIHVAANSNGYLVVWTDSRAYETTGYNIYAQRVNAAGEMIGDDLVLSGAPDSQVGPAVGAVAGQFLVAWLDPRGGTNTSIFGNRVDASGVLDGHGFHIGRAASSSAWNAPEVAGLHNQYLLVWVGGEESGYGHTDIVAARVTTAGVVLDTGAFLVSTVVSNPPPADSDGDGVPNVVDACPATAPGAVVNEHGCSIAQLCPCEGPWQNRLAYLSCVRETAQSFLEANLIGIAERDAIVAAARASNCGRQPPRLRVPLQCADEIRTNGCRLVIEMAEAGTCVVECSTDLQQWTPIWSNTVRSGTVEICDQTASTVPRRFYRIRPW